MTVKGRFLFSFLACLIYPGILIGLGNLSISLRTGTHDAGIVRDPILYCATGQGIDIYDVADPSAPVILCSLDTPGISVDLAFSADMLAVADGNEGIRLYSVADPANPSLLAEYVSTRSINALAFSDSLLAAATIPHGISLLRYTGSSIDSLSRITFNETVTGIALSDTLLIVGLSNSGFAIYNIQDPSQPVLLLPSYPVLVNDLAVRDTILCCASGTSGVQIFTIANPDSPGLLASYIRSDFIRSVMLADTLLACSGFLDSLYTASIEDPASPQHLYSFPTMLPPVGAAKDGELLYVPEGSVAELFSTPDHIKYSSLDSLETVTDAALVDSLAFVLVQGQGMGIVDIADPASPFLLSWYPQTPPIEQVLVQDSLVFLSCGPSGLSVLNVSDPHSPALVSTYNTTGTLHAIARRGSILLLADGGSGLAAISIENISDPVLLDSVALPGTSLDVVLADTVALVALGPKGFALVSVKDPEHLVLIDSITGAGFSTCLATNGSHLFLGTQTGAIPIYDLFSWSTPQLVATYQSPGEVHDLFLANNLLFAACGNGGIQIVECSNPSSPVLFDALDTPGISSGINPFLGMVGTADRFSFRLDSFAFTDTVPPAPVSGLTLEPMDSLIIVRWCNPHDADYRGTRALFKNDTFPSHPGDGTILLDHSSQPGSGDSVYHSGLPGDSTRFYYAIYAYDWAHNFSSPSLASAISASDTTPPGEVTQISFSFWGSLLEVRFLTPNDPDFAGVRTMFDTTHVPQHIHDGELFFDKPLYGNSNYAETLAVEHNRTYHFTFFSKDSVPNFSAGLSASFLTDDTIPPDEVTLQSVQFLSNNIRILFRTPLDTDFVGVRARYDLLQYPQHPDSGELFFHDTLNQNTSYLRILNDAILDTTYFFTFFTLDTALNFSAGLSCSCATIPDTIPPDTVLQFTASRIFPDTVKFTWINPPDTGIYFVRLKYDIDTYPPADSGYNIVNKLVTPGQPDSVKWNPGRPGINLFFSAFSYDRWGNPSKGVHDMCLTPTLTKVSSYSPVDGGSASWLDTVWLTFTAPVQQPTLQTGIDLKGRNPYEYVVRRATGNTYRLIPPSFASLDTIVITLHNTLIDSVGNPFDGDGDGIPDSVDDYSWTFFSALICDYTADDTINAEDFGVLKNALETQDITREVGPCTASAPYYVLIPDSVVDFEDFAIFIMMWNWSLDTKGIPLISADDRDSLILFGQRDDILEVSTACAEKLISGEIIIHDIGKGITATRGEGITDNDLFIAKSMDDDLLLSFGIMHTMAGRRLALIPVSSPLESIVYSYRLVYEGSVKEGRGTRMAEDFIPEKTVLRSIHPNPGIRMEITFGIPHRMHVSLDLYDISGRRVRSLVNRTMTAGYHTLNLNEALGAARIPAGVYFIRLKTEDASLVEKIIRVR
jgi:hypothetical protein